MRNAPLDILIQSKDASQLSADKDDKYWLYSIVCFFEDILRKLFAFISPGKLGKEPFDFNEILNTITDNIFRFSKLILDLIFKIFY